jgi:two-component system response regulator YesN
MKYRILIVDDEKIVLDSIEYMLENSEYEFIIQKARNGKEALLIADDFRPHILLSDIRMPGIDGVDLVKTIRKSNYKVKLIFISAYEQFEYAKVSIKYGVSDYILKPLTKKKLTESLDKVIKELDKEADAALFEMNSMERFSDLKEIILENFMKNLYRFKNKKSSVEEIVSFKFERGINLNIIISSTDKSKLNIFTKEIYKKIEKLFCDYKIIGTMPYNGEFHIFISGVNTNKETFSLIEKQFSLFLDEDFFYTVKIEEINENLYITNAYEFTRKPNIIIENDEWRTIISEFLKPNSLKFVQFVDTIFGKLLLCNQIIREKTYKNDLIKLVELIGIITINSNIIPLTNMSNIELENAKEYLMSSYLKFHSNSKKGYSPIIENALMYISRNKYENIGLEMLASKLFVTPQYLSKIFKDETGTTFKEYILELKMNLAKELIKEGKSINQISEKIGYNDVNYFIKSFKKHVGITPKEFMRYGNEG